MNKSLVSMMAAAAVLGTAGAVHAQLPSTPLSVEIRGGLAFPSGDLKDLDAGEGLETESGVGLAVNAQFQATPNIAVYGEYSWLQFGVKDIEDADVTDTGFGAGVKLAFPMGGFTPFARGGVVFHQIELSEGDVSVDAEDEEMGFQVGGGVEIPLGNRLSVTPGVTYTSYGIGDDTDDVTISHLLVDVGLKIRI